MKKEGLMAIIFGIVLGIVVAFLMILGSRQQTLNKSKTIVPNQKITPTVVATIMQFQNLEVTYPEDRSVFSEKTIKIKGKANKNSLIVIQSPIKDLIIKNDKEDFETDFTLAPGENVINIVSYPKDSNFRAQEKELRVYYFEEK